MYGWISDSTLTTGIWLLISISLIYTTVKISGRLNGIKGTTKKERFTNLVSRLSLVFTSNFEPTGASFANLEEKLLINYIISTVTYLLHYPAPHLSNSQALKLKNGGSSYQSLIGGEEGASSVINDLPSPFLDFLLCLFEFLITYKPLAL